MTERIMYNERHAEYNKQENEQQMILAMNVNTLVYRAYNIRTMKLLSYSLVCSPYVSA